jgi:sec-independent protein translocase protein TatB
MTILNIGPSELLFILILGLLVLGPERLPALARGIGTALRRMREIYVAFVSEFRNELQPIAQEVDTIASEIAGELQAIREATDLRSVLQPVADDIAKAADVNNDLNSLQRDIKAPAWEIPQSISGANPDAANDPLDYGPPPEAREAQAAEAAHPPPKAISVTEAILGPHAAASAAIDAAPDALAEADALELEAPEGEALPDYALAQNKTALSEEDILANILGPRVAPEADENETAGIIASDPLIIESDDEPAPEPVIAPPALARQTVSTAATTNGHAETRVVPPAGAFDLMSAVPNPGGAQAGAASIGRINLELTLDNPWGQIETPIRSDKLDEDSPWRG